nr:hypothetical protein [Streptomyces sp. TLI_053]
MWNCHASGGHLRLPDRGRDALFELTDAVLCTDGLVKTLVDLALAPSTGADTEPCTAR